MKITIVLAEDEFRALQASALLHYTYGQEACVKVTVGDAVWKQAIKSMGVIDKISAAREVGGEE